MRYFVLALFALSLIITSSCEYTFGYIDPAFKPYITRFVDQAKLNGIEVNTKNLTVVFGDLPKSKGKKERQTLGVCRPSSVNPVIVIHKEYWNGKCETDEYLDMKREELMFHELGHCVLDRMEHCDVPKGETRISIMDSYSSPIADYKENRHQYLKELFNADKRCVELDDDSDEGDETPRGNEDSQ